MLALVAGRGLTLAVIGVGAGGVAALLATQLVASQLYGFTGFDVTVFATASLLLLMLALVASYVPARAAAALDPVVALRQG